MDAAGVIAAAGVAATGKITTEGYRPPFVYESIALNFLKRLGMFYAG